jgi:hypothetical protein
MSVSGGFGNSADTLRVGIDLYEVDPDVAERPRALLLS